MTLAAPLPTTHDEAWRYADPAALTTLAPQSLDAWHEATVSAEEPRSMVLLLDDAHAGLNRVRITLGAGARAEIFALVSASEYTRLEVEVRLGASAHFEFGGVTIGGGGTVREIVTRLDHAEPGATSHQVVRAVHWGGATGNFLGRVAVARGAQKTDAAQDFKALLLERGASANAKPELEIFADDVKCAHGAAIGQLDEAARFYMAARGIPPEVADQLLVRAFIADAFTSLDNDVQQERLLAAALSVLEARA